MANHDGWVSLARLASATAQKEWTVRLGLEWLAAMGHISIISSENKANSAGVFEENGDRLRIAPGGVIDLPQAVILLEQIQALLEETHAYREFFLHRDQLDLIA